MDEVFETAVAGLGGESNYVELSKLRADSNVTAFFQKKLMKPLWPEETFATFFQSRPTVWDYGPKVRGVRKRSALTSQIEEMARKKLRTAPLPEKLYEALLRAGTMTETVNAITMAGNAEIAALPLETMEALLDSFGKPPDAELMPQIQVYTASQVKVLGGVPGVLAKKGSGLEGVMDFYKRVIKFGGDQPAAEVNVQKVETLRELSETAALVMREKGLGSAGPRHIASLCQTAPVHIVALAIAGLGEKGDSDDIKAVAGLLGKVPQPQVLEGLPPELLLRLATACTKSTSVAEVVTTVVATAASATLATWNLDDISKLLLALAKVKAGTSSKEVDSLYGRAAEALFPKLETMSDTHLIKVALAMGKSPSCKEFLEALADESVKRLAKIGHPTLVLLTQGLLPLGADNGSLKKVLDHWTLPQDADSKNNLSADQLAKLLQAVAPVAPNHAAFWSTLGPRLAAQKGSLTDAGKTAVLACFPDGSGPSFEGKEELLKAVRPPAREEKSSKDKGRDRDRDDRGDKDKGRSGSNGDQGRRDEKRGGGDDRRSGRDDRRDDRRDERRRSRSRGGRDDRRRR